MKRQREKQPEPNAYKLVVYMTYGREFVHYMETRDDANTILTSIVRNGGYTHQDTEKSVSFYPIQQVYRLTLTEPLVMPEEMAEAAAKLEEAGKHGDEALSVLREATEGVIADA